MQAKASSNINVRTLYLNEKTISSLNIKFMYTLNFLNECILFTKSVASESYTDTIKELWYILFL